jgi:hypothetical protein
VLTESNHLGQNFLYVWRYYTTNSKNFRVITLSLAEVFSTVNQTTATMSKVRWAGAC